MQRRRFLTSTLAASALSITTEANARQNNTGNSAGKGREYYELRRYQLRSGQQAPANRYFSEALIPALNRLGMKPVGVFNLDVGVQTPAAYVLIPSTSVESLVTAKLRLDQDDQYQKAGAAFLNATSKQPPFVAVESSLMIAFEGYPKLTVPAATAQNGARVFELRTYDSPSWHDHRRKVEMFHSGEFEIFQRSGFWPVFFGDTLIGSEMPNLTYMLSFKSLDEMNGLWDKFRSDPQWKKLTSSPRFNFDQIVTNINNQVLTPAKYSQI